MYAFFLRSLLSLSISVCIQLLGVGGVVVVVAVVIVATAATVVVFC